MLFANGKKTQSGFLTMEILLAMTVAVFALAGAVLVCFGGQSLDIGTAQNSEALVLAEDMIKGRQDAAANDFRLVNSTRTQAGIFTQKTEVSTHSFFTKKITASVSWDFGGRRQEVQLQTLISDWRGTAGNDTCDSNLSGDWKNPQVEQVIDFSDFAESASSTYAIGDIDVYKNKLYVAMEKTGTKTDATFFVFDVSDPAMPALLKKNDNAPTTIDGFGSFAVNKDYAYFANNHNSNFSTCPQNYNCAQLQIIDLNSFEITNFKVPNIFDKSGQGNSIFYRNGYVYLGLAKANGPEFNIINVNDINNPVVVGSFEIGAGINDIYVKGDYVYLAHPADLTSSNESGREQLTVLNIANPANPYRVGGFYEEEGMGGHGKSLKIIGNRIYLGRTTSHISGLPDEVGDFFILSGNDVSTDFIPILGQHSFSCVGSANKLIVRDNLAFVLLGTENSGGDLRVLNIADPGNIVEEKIVGLPGEAGGRGGVAMDCEGNYLYVASVDGQGKSYLSIITAK